VEYLIGLGHTQIAAFCGNADFHSNAQRLDGYRQALMAAGIAWREDYVFPGEYHADFGEKNARLLLERFHGRAGERPTAIFCFNDDMARGAVNGLISGGIHIPVDISVVGFDDNSHAVSSEPHLTTMRQDIRRLGELATEALLECVNGKLSPGARVHVPGELVIRDTTASPPERKEIK
jgi:LacI family repressor for deo operon, udp, cdd, tsx, nupC, and nupG